MRAVESCLPFRVTMSAAVLRHRGRLLVVVLVAGLIVVLPAAETVREVIGRGLDVAKEFILRHEVLGIALFAALSALSAIAFFFSTAVIVPVAVHAWVARIASVLDMTEASRTPPVTASRRLGTIAHA